MYQFICISRAFGLHFEEHGHWQINTGRSIKCFQSYVYLLQNEMCINENCECIFFAVFFELALDIF